MIFLALHIKGIQEKILGVFNPHSGLVPTNYKDLRINV